MTIIKRWIKMESGQINLQVILNSMDAIAKASIQRNNDILAEIEAAAERVIVEAQKDEALLE
jgi:hypothetical protein